MRGILKFSRYLLCLFNFLCVSLLGRFLEAEGLEKTFKFKQRDIVNAVDVASAQKSFELKLDTFGPYRINYTRNGRWTKLSFKALLATCKRLVYFLFLVEFIKYQRPLLLISL